MTKSFIAAALLFASRAAAAAEPATAPAVSLEFDAKTTRLAEVVARAQARLDAFGANQARAVQRAGLLVVELPASLVPMRGEIESLLTRPHVLAYTIMENGSSYMTELYRRIEQDPRSLELVISRDIKSWRGDAAHPVESDPFLEGRREALQRYLAGLGPAQRPDRDHAFRLCPVFSDPLSGVPDPAEPWRTEYVDLRTQIRITRVLEASRQRSEVDGKVYTDLVLRVLPADGDRIRALTGGHIGKKMVMTLDDEVLSTPIIVSAVADKSRIQMSDERLARRLGAALLGGPMLAPVTVRTRRPPAR